MKLAEDIRSLASRVPRVFDCIKCDSVCTRAEDNATKISDAAVAASSVSFDHASIMLEVAGVRSLKNTADCGFVLLSSPDSHQLSTFDTVVNMRW